MNYFITRKKEIEKDSFALFENISIENLINNYSLLETNLVGKIKEEIKLFFMFNEFICLDNTAQKNNSIYLYSVEQLKIERTLFIKISDINGDYINEKQIEIDIPNQIWLCHSCHR